MIKDKKYYRKPRRTFRESIAVPNQSIQLRTIIDRINRGEPVNSSLREHVPLPNDGEDLEDFDNGTEEITDIVDVIALQDELQAKFDEQQRQREKMLQEQQVSVDVAADVAKMQES